MSKQLPTFAGAMAACTLSLVLCSSNSAVAETDGPPNLAPGQSLGIALDIPPVPNLRDVGGYKTRDGATIVRGLAYRSDTFHPMTAEDDRKLKALRLKNDYDLRTAVEAKAEPDQMPPGVKYHLLNVLADAKSSAPAELEKLLREPKKANAALGHGKIEALFMEGYREFISLPSARQSYRTLFLSLADRKKLPAVFHCTTGKDRTGWAAAALLTLLGVPPETVMEDYMRTNEYTLPQFKRTIDEFVEAGGDRDIAVAVFGVKPEYLEASFDEMRKQYGSIERYFSDGLDIDVARQQVLRDLFLGEK
ncbi:MAG TPA: tyrosine-protein phosphatase [Candidatus Competibacter phosphatis]|nr:tyrosine-protein phosphatase [Candidatus Competibacter phosphatis]HMR02694.1 tyrosine-protein phosphatase [Candidatus Competibacter phosphatis]